LRESITERVDELAVAQLTLDVRGMVRDPSLCAATIAAKSFLSYARALAISFRQHHPEVPFYVLLADEVDGFFVPEREPFAMLTLDELEIPHLARFRFHYPQQPLSYAATPYLLAHLLRRGFSRVVFLKQESLVLGSFGSVYEQLASSSLVLTPHLVRPLEGADRIARELNILQSGTFNIGLMGVADTPPAHRFLAWWQDRVFTHCRHAVAEGMHYEQRWVDLAPALFDGVCILRDPAYNVGHWNLPERRIAIDGERVTVDGEPCRLFRFSGYDPDDPGRLTVHTRRLDRDNAGPAVHVFDRFRDALERAGYHETRHWPYAYATFDNGVPIPDIARRIYLDLGDAGERFGDPRRTAGDDSFFAWLNDSDDLPSAGEPAVSRLWQAIHASRRDLQEAFRDPLGSDRDGFLAWTIQSGRREHRIPEQFTGGRHR
jgi:hypothetical protein